MKDVFKLLFECLKDLYINGPNYICAWLDKKTEELNKFNNKK